MIHHFGQDSPEAESTSNFQSEELCSFSTHVMTFVLSIGYFLLFFVGIPFWSIGPIFSNLGRSMLMGHHAQV